MRILHVLDHSVPMHSGYAFRTRAIMKAQLGRGWHTLGVTGARHIASGPDPESAEGLLFFRTPRPAAAPSPLREWREIKALSRRIGEVVAEFGPDLIHAHSPVLSALAAKPIAAKLGLPFVYEIRAFWEDAAVANGAGREGDLRYRATHAIETRACEQADALVVICEGLRRDLTLRGIPADKIVVAPNGVDLNLFGMPPPRDAALGKTLGIAADAEAIGFIGSFYDFEGLDILIAAMPALLALRPRLHLLLVGGGPAEAALRRAAAASPAAERIRFVGRVPHDEVERYYSLIDVLVYPRKRSRLTELVTPLKPLEAMAQGKLVAASDVGGHRELIEDGRTGTLFAADDAPALAAALGALFADRRRWPQRRKTARAFVERERNWSSNISRYEPLYQKLVGAKS